jgi:hypothetical protein
MNKFLNPLKVGVINYHGANINDLKALKQELADPWKEDAKYG